jgi:ribosome-binding factor A
MGMSKKKGPDILFEENNTSNKGCKIWKLWENRKVHFRTRVAISA